jgi:hypothetical protein
VRAYRDAGDDLAELHAKLDRVQDRIDTESLNAEEWNILYRLRLQAEHEVFEREVRGGDDGGGNGRPAGRGDRPGVSGRTSGRRSRRP